MIIFSCLDTMREVGTATTVMKQLDKITSANDECAKVAWLYPHEIFQGDILEGIVIRYVPYYSNATPANDDDGNNVSAKQKSVDEMKGPLQCLERNVELSASLNKARHKQYLQ